MSTKGTNITARNPGLLRHEVTIQALSHSRTGIGEAVDVFTDWQVNIPAQVEGSKGREFWASQQLQADTTNIVSMRYIDPDDAHPNGVEPKMRIVYGTRLFDILYVNDQSDRHIWLDIECRELIQT